MHQKDHMYLWSCRSGRILVDPCDQIGSHDQPIIISMDNQGAIALSKDNKFHTRTKHIDIQYHFVWAAVQSQKLSFKYIPGTENPADIFTKALPKVTFVKFTKKLGLHALKG